MLAVSLVIGSLVTVIFFVLGLLVGWVSREYMVTYQEGAKRLAYHPEFYNKEGELIDEEIVSVRFDPEYFDYTTDDVEEDSED
jgi:hypothetical protein